ncbi:UNVERIFIED_CONTAM: Transposon Ty3-G Gag-Pol polyprotein, partial [Sesamum indicum]
MHDSALGGHSGITGTLQRLKMLFFWPTVKEEVNTWVREWLPKSDGKEVILVIVDRLTKYSHFIALKHPYTVVSIEKIFFEHVYKLHGLLLSIVTDRDKIFTSYFWEELFSLTGVSLDMSSAYHPQTDGQTEIVNQCLETYL